MKQIVTSEEIDRLIENTSGREKRNLKHLKTSLKMFIESEGKMQNIWTIFPAIESQNLLKDILVYMVSLENK